MNPILAVDYGRKHIGLAISDSGQTFARRLDKLSVNKHQTPTEALAKFLKNRNLDMLLVGLPTGLEGKPTKMSIEVKDFAEAVAATANITTDFWDETYTSKQAERTASSKSKNKSAQSHSEAARIILQAYLDHQHYGI